MHIKRQPNVKGVIEMRRGEDNARIKILAFKKGSVFTYDENDIREEFPPAGYVIAFNLFSKEEYVIGDLLEFSTLPVENRNGLDEIRLDSTSRIKMTGMEVFSIKDDILDNPLAVDQARLKAYITEATDNFYIQNSSFLYGPFKLSGNEVVSAKEPDINRYQASPPVVSIGDKQYLLERPTEVEQRIDCSTNTHLAIWFKKYIKTLQYPMDVQQLPQLLDRLDNGSLDKAKLSRVVKLTDSLLLTRQELELLSENSPSFQQIFSNSLLEIRPELIATEKIPLDEKLSALQAECSQLSSEAVALRQEIERLSIQKNNLSKDVDFVQVNKDRLIADIKIATSVSDVGLPVLSVPIAQKSLVTFELQQFEKKGTPFGDLPAFIKRYEGLLEQEDLGFMESRKALFQLRDKRAVLCTNPLLVRLIALYSNNCKLFIQQVEADWLKFESFYDNGLSEIWQSAHDNPEIIHFLLLEDINMAPIECYARPLLDLIVGLRKTLPGLQTPWPENLWIFGIPIEKGEEPGFGVPLLINSFKHWGAMPVFSHVNSEIEKDDRFLPVQVLLNHSAEFAIPSMNSYFS